MLKNIDYDKVKLIAFISTLLAGWIFLNLWILPKLGVRT